MQEKLTEKQAEQLTDWYEKNRRSLPWRDTGNPYHVWISEIMLQQTRIEAVIPKYEAFIRELPDTAALARCDDDRLMRLWEGLGYYSRARNLKKCAEVLTENFGGRLPEDYALLKKLPGIGPYTAGAIASIAFSIPVPAVDGNVLRVLARVFAVREDIRSEETKKHITDTLSEVYGSAHVSCSSFNQGMMELGETLCLPAKPHCSTCPWNESCLALQQGTVSQIPYRSPLKQRKIIRRTLLVIREGEKFMIRRRPERGLLAGLYEFIGIDEDLEAKDALAEAEKMGMTPLRIRPLPDSVHVFTHLEWHMKAYEIRIAEGAKLKDGCILVSRAEIADKALPSAFRAYTRWYALREDE